MLDTDDFKTITSSKASVSKPSQSRPTASTADNPKPQEKRFTYNEFTYAAQLWGEDGGIPVIALHGWLDNSASFDILAPQLSGMQCLAIDLAGHGFSDHKAGFADYPLWSEVAAIYAIADEMGWDKFALIGHSRGAMMALLTAGVYPDRITHIVFLDSIMPPVVANQESPDRMVSSLKEINARLRRPLSLYQSFDEAITARCMSRYAPVSATTAEYLATRGLREIEGQYHWHADGKLWAPSNVALSYDMAIAFAQKIAEADIPSLLLLGEQGLVKRAKPETEFTQHCDQVIDLISAQVEVFDDGHFLHMETAASDVVSSIIHFFAVEHHRN